VIARTHAPVPSNLQRTEADERHTYTHTPAQHPVRLADMTCAAGPTLCPAAGVRGAEVRQSTTQRTGIFATRDRADLGTLAEQRVGVHVELHWLLLLHCAAPRRTKAFDGAVPTAGAQVLLRIDL
jgi:hypothetical protein